MCKRNLCEIHGLVPQARQMFLWMNFWAAWREITENSVQFSKIEAVKLEMLADRKLRGSPRKEIRIFANGKSMFVSWNSFILQAYVFTVCHIQYSITLQVLPFGCNMTSKFDDQPASGVWGSSLCSSQVRCSFPVVGDCSAVKCVNPHTADMQILCDAASISDAGPSRTIIRP